MEDSKLEALFEEFLLIYKVVNRKNMSLMQNQNVLSGYFRGNFE